GEDGKKVVGRLIDIWDERKVFGTRIESLKDDILGGSTHTMGNNGNSSNPSSHPSSVSKAVRKRFWYSNKKTYYWRDARKDCNSISVCA
ncbi:hypothetical protein EE612_053301, partial [Oryza sativa]